jgi:hypothetical protein
LEPSQSSTEEEQGILRVINQLCPALAVDFRAVGISWMGTLGYPTNLPSDQCFLITRGSRRGFVALPVALRGRLSLDDWKPIVASCIFHQLGPGFRRVWYTAYILYRIAVFGSIALLVFFLFLLPQPIFAVVDTVFAMVAIFILPKIYNYYIIRRSRLRADLKAADTVGRDLFIQTLVKIDGFHILDLEELKRSKRTMWQRRVYPWPTLIERLDNLRTPMTPSSTS